MPWAMKKEEILRNTKPQWKETDEVFVTHNKERGYGDIKTHKAY